MTLGMAFWVLMLIWAVFIGWRGWADRVSFGGNLLIFVLFLLLGWRVFGAPLHA